MIRGLWDRETVALLLLAALLPVASAWLWYGGGAALLRLLLALTVSGLWHVVFMILRAQPPSFAGAVTALGVAMFAPLDLGLVAMLLGISFGTVMGELVFGGWGRNVLNPATVTLAFLGFGYPGVSWPDFLLPVAWAAIPTAALGVVFGVMPGRVILGAVLVLIPAWVLGLQSQPELVGAALVLVVLVSDPVASGSTRLGGWLNGLAYGALVVLFAVHWTDAAPVQLAVSAALLAGLSAPLLDEIAIALWVAGRTGRHG